MHKEIRNYLRRVNWNTIDNIEAYMLDYDDPYYNASTRESFFDALLDMEASGEIKLDRDIVHYHGE